MGARTFQKNHQIQKKRGNTKRRSQAKKDINRALNSRASDFADDACKITELYEQYAGICDAEGFADAVMGYVSESQTLIGYVSEFHAIIDGHRYLRIPQEQVETTPTIQEPKIESAKDVYVREQKRLEAMNLAFHKLLERLP